MVDYTRAEKVSLRLHPTITEKWIQDLIANDPSILGLGDLELRQKERIQPRAGRLDLLLQDSDTKRRYEVELQLGATDETHIVRTIEYWDIERKRYPQYDHCAVIIAEEITGRFLNVLSLFNGTIPLIAIQMQALTVGGQFSLVFTKVLDELSRGLVDEDEDAEAAPATRVYWEEKASKSSLADVDRLLEVLRSFDAGLELRYNKHYIGLGREGSPFNFVSFRPKRTTVNIELKLPQSDDVDARIDSASLDPLEYNVRWGQYRLRLSHQDITNKQPALTELMRLAYERRAS